MRTRIVVGGLAHYGTLLAVGTKAETPPTNIAPALLPGLSSETETRCLDWEREPVNLSGDEREEKRAAAFLDFIFPCLCVCVCE